jgi:uncharacterized protein YyaL (SSP411 family)
MAKEYKVRFEGVPEDFTDYGIEYSKDKDGNTVTKQVIDEPFVIKRGQTKTIDEKTYKYLTKKGVVKTLAEQEEIERVKAKLVNKRSKRPEPKKDVQFFSDDEVSMVFNDMPFEVEE